MSISKSLQFRRFLLAVTAAVALCLAAGSISHAAAGAPAKVKTRHGKLGTFLVDGKGRTLYLFQKDKTSKSTCDDACAEAWPPLLTTGKATASGSARKGLLGTTKRADGTTQVTYNHHPVYRFANDKKAGDTKGQAVRAFGAKWYVLAPSGKKIGGY
jgi:predicted lipoprotein with Yx(FWY)xxD motif